MAGLDQEALNQELKKRRICRFCLSQDQAKLSNIYMRDTRIKTSAPLPIQIMAIASIEVFSNDGMPGFVCSDCTSVFEYSYQFKQMCKKADNLLRQYPLTGQWPKQLQKPVLMQQPSQAQQSANILNKQRTQTTQIRMQQTKQIVTQESLLQKKVILNSAPAPEPVPPQPVRTKVEKIEEEGGTTSNFLSKIENNDELSLDDIHQLVAAEDVEEKQFVNMDTLPVVMVDSGNKSKPKLLNKASVRILNKEASREKEPRLSLPKIKKGQDGNMEIVAEILDYDEPYETEADPKNAEVIETNVYPCPHCERSFPLMQLRDIHMKNHTRDRKFQCEECDKCFFSKYDLQRHSFTHNGSKPYKCSACDKAFSRTSLLQRHEKSHTDIPKYICVTCERPFISKEAMEKHADRHKINRPFQCKLCNKGFAFKQGLERHEVIHSRQQPYSCQYCDQSFSTTGKLARHLTAHAGERPYPCKFCKKSYLLSHHLTRHMRSHKNAFDSSSMVSFMCSRCDSSFETRDELFRHSATHADEQNLSCPLCKEVFDTIDNLTAHIREHSDGEAHACEFCDLIFMTADKLQAHTDTDHAQEMEAYHENDRVQAEQMMGGGSQNESEVSEDNLQTTVDEMLHDDSLENEMEQNSTKPIKQEKSSPKVIKQIVIKAPQQATDHNTEDNSLLVPLKKIKIEGAGKEVVPQPTVKPKPSPQLRRRVPASASSNQPVRDKNQPSIQSLLKIPKGVTIKKTAGNNDSQATGAQSAASPQSVSASTSKNAVENSSSTSNQSIVKMKIGDRNVKVQKIRVTKAEAAAMAKEGRIRIKDGQIILTQEHK